MRVEKSKDDEERMEFLRRQKYDDENRSDSDYEVSEHDEHPTKFNTQNKSSKSSADKPIDSN